MRASSGGAPGFCAPIRVGGRRAGNRRVNSASGLPVSPVHVHVLVRVPVHDQRPRNTVYEYGYEYVYGHASSFSDTLGSRDPGGATGGCGLEAGSRRGGGVARLGPPGVGASVIISSPAHQPVGKLVWRLRHFCRPPDIPRSTRQVLRHFRARRRVFVCRGLLLGATNHVASPMKVVAAKLAWISLSTEPAALGGRDERLHTGG